MEGSSPVCEPEDALVRDEEELTGMGGGGLGRRREAATKGRARFWGLRKGQRCGGEVGKDRLETPEEKFEAAEL